MFDLVFDLGVALCKTSSGAILVEGTRVRYSFVSALPPIVFGRMYAAGQNDKRMRP